MSVWTFRHQAATVWSHCVRLWHSDHLRSVRCCSLPCITLLVAQILSVAAIACLSPLDSGFPLDDAWIHQTAARNLAESGTLGLVQGRFAAGATSVLWVVLLAVNHALIRINPSTFSVLLSTSLMVASGQMVVYAARRDGWDRSRAWVYAFMLSIGPNYAWFALSGMEVALATTLLLAGVLCWFWRPGSTRTAAGCGIALGLGVLARPESLALCVVVLANARRAGRSLWQVALAGAEVAAIALIYVIASYVGSGHAGPSTLDGRRWLWLQEVASWPWYEVRLRFIGSWLDRIWTYTLGEPPLCLFWLWIGLAVLGAFECWRSAPRIGLLVVLAIVQLFTYLVMLPTEGHGGRYQSLSIALLLPVACEGGRMVIGATTHRVVLLFRHTGWLSWVMPTLVMPTVIRCLSGWARAHALAVGHINRTEAAAGRWVSELPPHSRVASFDVGAISYFGSRPLLDLGGLSDPSVLRDVVQGRIVERLRSERVEFVIMPVGYSDEFPDPANFAPRLGLLERHYSHWIKVCEFATPLSTWEPGFRATYNAAPRQFVFRVNRNAQGTE